MKNINLFKKVVLPLFFLLTAQSCEDWVEADLPDNQLATNQVFEDAATAKAAVAGLCASLRDQSVFSGNVYGTGALLGSYTDDLDCYYQDSNGYKDLYFNEQQATNAAVEQVWNMSYKQIYAANSIIMGLSASTGIQDEEKNQLKGEAIMIRSLLYFYLERIFGEIPYTTELDYGYNSHLGKFSEEALLARLTEDMQEANGLLTDAYRDYERAYPNRETGELLLAEIYMAQGNWTGAEALADAILQSGLYAFETDVDAVFHNTGTHILWQFPTSYAGASTAEASFYFFADSAPPAYALAPELISAFEPGDLRLAHWIEPVSFNGTTYYRNNKYKNLAGSNNDEYSVVFRLAEVYFIMAESLARQNRVGEALPYLNAIRERAGLAPLGILTADDFLQALLKEKRCEYFAEHGARFFDLKRMGQLEVLSMSKPNWMPFHRVWPLPENELLLNNNLNPQNEGY